jgi:predicted membrane channel-forming protein YqfA (hemolysin III family)
MFCFEDVYVIGRYGILKVTCFLVVHSLFFQSLELLCNLTDTWSNIWVSRVCLLSLTTFLLHSQLFHNPIGSSPSSKFHSELGHCHLHQCLVNCVFVQEHYRVDK